MRTLGRVVTACFVLCALLGLAADWPQYRGPDRDGVSKEAGLLKTWPKDGPPLAWTYNNAGVGYSSPSIVGDRLYLMGARGDTEFVYALDLKEKTPKELWAVKIGPKFTWQGNSWNEGPSASPTVDGELLYALGGLGELVCVDTSGKERWRKNLPKEMGADVNPVGGGPEKLGWGFAWSPLVDGEQLVCVPGGKQGTLAALSKKTGAVVWQSKELTDQAPYSSPSVFELGGVRQYMTLTNRGVFGVSAKDGKLLWSHLRGEEFDDIVGSMQVIDKDHVYYSMGTANGGCELVKVSADGGKFKAEKVYGAKDIASYHGGVVKVGDNVYGSSHGKGWCCQNFLTGKLAWSERRALGAGAVMAAEGQLYCLEERDGFVVLAEAKPDGWKENGRFKLPQESKLKKSNGRIWTHPVIANGKLYLRDQELLFCYNIKGN